MDIAALLSELLLPALRLELFPKLSIDIHILVLEADSDAAVLSSGLTAACAAVADAGIPLTGLVVGSLIVSSPQAHEVDPISNDRMRMGQELAKSQRALCQLSGRSLA